METSASFEARSAPLPYPTRFAPDDKFWGGSKTRLHTSHVVLTAADQDLGCSHVIEAVVGANDDDVVCVARAWIR
jgi:hypothetical protein